MRRISDIRFVDLQRSKVDWTKSDTKKGKYVFKESPVYVDYKSDDSPVPDHKVQWVEHSPMNVSKWQYKFGYSVVLPEEKRYWPEGVEINAEGRYQVSDMILMMCPAQVYVDRKRKEAEIGMRAGDDLQKKFRQDAARDGIEVYDEGEVQDMRKHLRR